MKHLASGVLGSNASDTQGFLSAFALYHGAKAERKPWVPMHQTHKVSFPPLLHGTEQPCDLANLWYSPTSEGMVPAHVIDD